MAETEEAALSTAEGPEANAASEGAEPLLAAAKIAMSAFRFEPKPDGPAPRGQGRPRKTIATEENNE
ncbi:MAG: hypothetical protein ABSC62_00585 [Terracidiphilus sp.]|jgi:hypothetical protein